MSVRRNILANYASQLYAAVVGVLTVPMYIRYMGSEAYGLVGFFVMMLAWFQLLDMGITPTLSRETAKLSKGSQPEINRLWKLLRTTELTFAALAGAGCLAMIASSAYISEKWLNIERLTTEEVRLAVILMAINIGLRLMSGLYRSAITGFERLVWLGGFNIIVTTIRFLLVIPFFVLVGATPKSFFSYQLIVSFFELVILAQYTYHLFPERKGRIELGWKSTELRSLLKFSLSIAFANLVWVAVLQSDKLILSKLLTLESYAYFSIATMLANGIFLLSNPVSVPLLPRLTRLVAEGQDTAFVDLYREATQLVGVIIIPATLVLSTFAEQILWIWTGNAKIAHEVAPVLALYSLGNAFVAFGAFPYYLQYAKGNLRLHIIATFLLIITLLPAIIFGALHYGIVGAGYAWLAVNGLYLLFWTAKVHSHFVAGLHWKWFLVDIGAIAFGDTIIILLVNHFLSWPASRLTEAIYATIISAMMLAFSFALSSQMRNKILRQWRMFSRSKGK